MYERLFPADNTYSKTCGLKNIWVRFLNSYSKIIQSKHSTYWLQCKVGFTQVWLFQTCAPNIYDCKVNSKKFWVSNILSECVIILMSNEQFFSHITPRTSHIRWDDTNTLSWTFIELTQWKKSGGDMLLHSLIIMILSQPAFALSL